MIYNKFRVESCMSKPWDGSDFQTRSTLPPWRKFLLFSVGWGDYMLLALVKCARMSEGGYGMGLTAVWKIRMFSGMTQFRSVIGKSQPD